MQALLTHLKRIPKFATKRERNVWFCSCVAALALGGWFFASMLRFHSDPASFTLAPTSMIPLFWFVAAVGLAVGGGVGLYLGLCRLERKTKI